MGQFWSGRKGKENRLKFLVVLGTCFWVLGEQFEIRCKVARWALHLRNTITADIGGNAHIAPIALLIM